MALIFIQVKQMEDDKVSYYRIISYSLITYFEVSKITFKAIYLVEPQ